MSFQRKMNGVVIGAFIGSVTLFLLSLLLPQKYLAQGKLLFHRNPVEIPALVFEESKNRWAWVRDGYALQAIATSDEAEKRCEKGSKLQATLASGDDFMITVDVRGKTAVGAQECATRVMDLVAEHAATFRLKQLKSAVEALKTTKFREEAIAAYKLEESFSGARVQVLKQPILPTCARWPNKGLFAAIGGFFGGALTWLLLLYKKTK